jgi:hypothetical protein
MSGETMTEVTPEDHEKAFKEVAFLLDIFTATIDNVMGGATAPVGRIAGREMAKKLPVYLNNPSLEEAVTLLASKMRAGFAFSLEQSATDAEIVFSRCVLRDACSLRGLATGNAMCRLFHAYFDGILNELIYRPVKSELLSSGDACRARIRTQ